ncbi:uncharacterized protein BX663DRAFT_434909 [Cokeromyces recurvatus]|uniref:uncharacterized protein n=1 Tax=Cokeromyces recurvatus TaxID=90255 RepID=UPI00222016C7|nr:uncharacterized protein BX663DRAFT_434909 [Cokeromyces recurvatus]KAI7902739.1 hypothetical protein BX663DRAFT_434909 [Cokeromyces recurvatus]
MSFSRLTKLCHHHHHYTHAIAPRVSRILFNFNKNRSISLISRLKSDTHHVLQRSEQQKRPSFTTSPYNEALKRIKSQAKLVGKISGYTVLSVTAAVAFIWQLSHWYIEYFLESTPPELGYQARNLLHGAHVREKMVPDYEIAAFYVKEALRIALEEKQLDEHSMTVIQLRLRLAFDEAHAGNLLDAITQYTRAWKLMLDKKEDSILLVETAKSIGDLYLRIQDEEHAEEFLAWALYRSNELQSKEGSILHSKILLTLASLYAIQHQFELALPLLTESLKILPEEAVCLKAIVQNQLSEVMYGLGKVDASMGWAQASLNSSAKDTKNRDCLECGGVAANNLGKLLELKGDFKQAIEYYNQAVIYASSIHDSTSYNSYLLNLERVQEVSVHEKI